LSLIMIEKQETTKLAAGFSVLAERLVELLEAVLGPGDLVKVIYTQLDNVLAASLEDLVWRSPQSWLYP